MTEEPQNKLGVPQVSPMLGDVGRLYTQSHL